MLLEKLRCHHFKRHTDQVFHFSPRFNIVTGPNGVGKTSLLDAIHYLTLTKSAFSAMDQANVQHHQTAFALQGWFASASKSYEVLCTYRTPGSKSLQCNGVVYQKLSEHIGVLPLVFATPYDADLIRGGSELRRRFFDGLLCQLDRSYLATLLQYNAVLKRRNEVLKQRQGAGKLDYVLLDSYDQQLLPLGHKLCAARTSLLNQFRPFFQAFYQQLSGAQEAVQLHYQSELAKPDFEQRFLQSLAHDVMRQHTTMGAHRDDFVFLLADHPFKTVGSQGQQKTFVTALRLAQYRCLQQVLQLPPLLLLDDVFEKLDRQRVEGLLTLLSQPDFGQIFLTTTSLQPWEGWLNEVLEAYKCIPMKS